MSGARVAGRWRGREARAGSTIAHPLARTIERDEQLWLAWVTGNASAVHGDANRSAAGAFGDVVVLGALTVAVVVGLAEPEPGPVTGGWPPDDVQWSAIELLGPVRPGDTIRAESLFEDVSATETGGPALVTRVVRGRNQHGSVVVQIRESRHVAW